MIIEDLQEFIKLNNIDSETKEYTSDDKISRLQGKVSPSKGNKYTPKNGLRNLTTPISILTLIFQRNISFV